MTCTCPTGATLHGGDCPYEGRRKLNAKPSAQRKRAEDNARREREVEAAKLEAALRSLADLERIIMRIGGFMTPEDQARLREAQALLVEHGRRASKDRPVWVDRVAPVVVGK